MKLIPNLNARDMKSVEIFSKKFKECEILFWGKECDQKLMKDVKEKMDKHEMSAYAVHVPNFRINEDDREINRLLDFVLKVNYIFYPKIINMHCQYGNVEKMKENLRIVLQMIPENVVLTIENLTKASANIYSPESAENFFKDMNYENLGLCLDISHIQVRNEKDHTKDVLEFIERMKNKIKHIHISDVKKIDNKISSKFIKHQPIGEGIIEWKKVKEKLIEINYNGYATIEYMPEYNERIEKAVDFLREL